MYVAPAPASVSIVTPTLRRPVEVRGLIENVLRQTQLPRELIIVDGAPESETETQEVIRGFSAGAIPFHVRHIRHGGGTAIQRNAGIDAAQGAFIAFIDDDIRLEESFFETVLEVFESDVGALIGGVAGYISNQRLDPNRSLHWRWYRRLRLFTTYEPGRYDYATGYPINRYLQPPHDGIRELDFMGAGCAVWRRRVFESGLRFSPFFEGYGILEDAHLALRAKRSWRLVECGRARCVHLSSEGSREDPRLVSQKTALNYRYVFMDIVPRRSVYQEFRFWRVQLFELARFAVYAAVRPSRKHWAAVRGKVEGIVMALLLRSGGQETPSATPESKHEAARDFS